MSLADARAADNYLGPVWCIDLLDAAIVPGPAQSDPDFVVNLQDRLSALTKRLDTLPTIPCSTYPEASVFWLV